MVTLENLFAIYEQAIGILDNPDEIISDSVLVLTTRNGFEDYLLTVDQQLRLDELDDQLVKRWKVVAEALPNPNFADDRRQWWWFLNEGPQVREQAKALAA